MYFNLLRDCAIIYDNIRDCRTIMYYNVQQGTLESGHVGTILESPAYAIINVFIEYREGSREVLEWTSSDGSEYKDF